MELLDVYEWIAVTFGALFVIQWVLALFGIDSLDSVGLETNVINETMSSANPLYSYFSIRNIVNFLVAFATTAYFLEKDYGAGIHAPLIGLFVGLLFVVLNVFLFAAFMQLERAVEITRQDLISCEGVVLIGIPATRTGRGKVCVNVNGTIADYFAITDGEAIKESSTIIIVNVYDNWDLLVRTSLFQFNK